ncbi:MAG: putative serine protease PepD [Actinomycetota bacterium]|nr:putative serine protease PepD [Actinomycetota bacterium]
MSQQPLPDPYEPYEPSRSPEAQQPSEHTAPLWYERTQAQPQYPRYPAAAHAPAEAPPAPFAEPDLGPREPARGRRLAEIGASSLLAAILASGGTYALTRDNLSSSPAAVGSSQSSQSSPAPGSATTPGPVVQANPSAPNWSSTAAVVSPSVVAISISSSQASGQGSGVIFDKSGRILTNNHVVAAGGANSQLSVTLNDKRTFDATVVGTDPSTDLAVIQLKNPPNDLRPIALGDSSKIKVGDPTMAVGNPLGLAGTVTTGIVSSLNRPVTTSDQQADPSAPQATGDSVVTNAIQTSAAINPGNSGGALVNGSGQLIGINSAIASLSSGGSSQSGNIGIGFAIPVNEARSIAEQLISSGKATHPYLGVASKDGFVGDGPAKRAAAVLSDVVAGTPADKAGLRAGDAIIAINGNPVDGSLSLVAQVREHSVGDTVSLKILRSGQTRDASITLTAKPATNQ